MPDVHVDPAYLDTLKAFLSQAQQSLDAGFKAPRSSAGGYPDKLFNTHGFTASAGSSALMGAIDENRGAVHKHLGDCLKRLDEALQSAKAAYLATDQDHGAVLNRQMNAGG